MNNFLCFPLNLQLFAESDDSQGNLDTGGITDNDKKDASDAKKNIYSRGNR